MDCRRFRQQHVEFVDDTLPAIQMVAMRRHLRACVSCATHDARVRRSLLLFRNQPEIQPSPEFRARLAERLREIGPYDLESAVEAALRRPAFWRPHGAAGLLSAAAGMIAAGFLAFALAVDATPEPLTLPPVVASIPEPEPAPMADPMLLASVPSGVTLWPAVLMAEQAPMHFAGTEFQLTSWGR